MPNIRDVKYYLLSTFTRIFLGKLRKYHKDEPQLLVFSKDFIGEEVYAYGAYEKNEIKAILSSLDFDCSTVTALDIGANIGNHAIQFSYHFKKVICFEPNGLTFEVLKINTRHTDNVELNNVGLSNKQKSAFLSVPDQNVGGASITSEKNKGDTAIELRIGDENISEEFGLIKIDIEGHEKEALEGLQRSIAQYKPVICFELINTEENAKALIGSLKGMGYEHFYIPRERGLFGNRSKSFFFTFLNGLFFKKSQKLVEIKRFDRKFYNLIICEHPDSNYRIKETNVIN